MESSKETAHIVKKHLARFFKQDYKGLMELYAEETVVVGYGKMYRGYKEIQALMESAGKEWFEGESPYVFDITFETFNGRHGYIEIKGQNHMNEILFGNSSYYVVNGKIMYEAAGRYVVPVNK